MYCTFLFSSIVITQLLSAGLKSQLHLLSISEMEKFHTLTLNFGDGHFEINVSRHFRSNSDKSIDRTLKMLFKEVLGSFLRPTIPELWRFFENQLCFSGQKHTNI